MRIRCTQVLWFVVIAVLAPQAPAQLIIAHRGASYDAPENTLAAFRLAWRQGADGVEGDFYLSSDGRIVCIHDKDTERTAGEKLVVAESTFAALRALDVGAWKDAKYRGERIATIEEVLATVPRDKKIFIELKVGPEIIEPLAAVLQMSSVRLEQVVVISFNDQTIAACEKRMPNLKTQWLTGFENEKEDDSGAWSPTAAEVAATIQRIGADGLGCQAETRHVDDLFLSRLGANGITYFGVWTVNDLAVAQIYQELNAAAITTDRPGWLRKQLEGQPALEPAAAGATSSNEE
jgi:glycerophosphoryl diester phosphodiesterase